jgi:hypothetical protein
MFFANTSVRSLKIILPKYKVRHYFVVCGIDGKIVDFGLSRLSPAESMNVYIGRSNSGPLKVLASFIISVMKRSSG